MNDGSLYLWIIYLTIGGEKKWPNKFFAHFSLPVYKTGWTMRKQIANIYAGAKRSAFVKSVFSSELG